jgi:hypothetical protein
MQRRSIGFVVALVAVAIATAACSSGGNSSSGNTNGAGGTTGGGNVLGGQLTHDQYQQKITQIATDFQKQEKDSFGSLGNIQNPNDIAKLADQFNKAADDIDGVADELDGLNPPDDAKDANAKFVSGFHGIADELRQFAQAAADKDLQKMQQLGTEFQNSKATKDLNSAQHELEKAGYTVPNSSSST